MTRRISIVFKKRFFHLFTFLWLNKCHSHQREYTHWHYQECHFEEKKLKFADAEECKEMEKALLENNGNTVRHIPGPLPLRDLSRVDGFLLLSL